jgi:cellulose synthase (UDP-forming)
MTQDDAPATSDPFPADAFTPSQVNSRALPMKDDRSSRIASAGRAFSRHVKAIHLVAVLAGLAGVAYLIVRVAFTRAGSTAWLFWPLLAAEAFGWVSLMLFTLDAWAVPEPQRRAPLDVPVDLLVPTYNEGAEVLEATFVGCAAVRGDVTVWVLDDGRRDWVRAMAESFGYKYVTRTNNDHAKAGNINNALPMLGGELILVLDADHVPLPDIVEVLSSYFTDSQLALVQSPHNFRNRDSAQHHDSEHHEQSLFFEVLLPGRVRTDGVFWCGSGAMLRRAHLMEVGGVSTKTITEDLETSLLLRRHGYTATYHNELLLQGLAPHNLTAYIIQRDRWARGTLQVLLGRGSPLYSRVWNWRARLSYLSNIAYYVLPIQRMVFALVLVATLWTGLLPLGHIPWWFMIVWAIWTVLSLTSTWALSRGRQTPSEGARNSWTTASTYLGAWWALVTRRKTGFAVTPKHGVDEGSARALRLLWLPATVLVAVVVSLVFRWTIQTTGVATSTSAWHHIETSVLVIITAFAFWELWTLSTLLFTTMRRQQSRQLWRFPVALSATLNGVPALVTDLNEVGARVEVSADRVPPEPFELVVAVRTPDGSRTLSSGHFVPRQVQAKTASNPLTIGGEIEWRDPQARRAVLFHCYVWEPLIEREVLEGHVTADAFDTPLLES